MKKILFTTSTLPSSDTDPVPAFVKDEAIWFKKLYPNLEISVLAPHNAYERTRTFTSNKYYDEYRFHYFWPFRYERLTGRGIQPALKKHKWLYLELPGLFVAEFFSTWQQVRKLKPDLIYAHWFTPQALTGALVSKITGVPLVFDTQASDAIVLKKLPLARKTVAAVCRIAYAYTAPSQQTADKLLFFATSKTEAMITNKLHMVPYGTTPVPINRSTIDRVQKKYGLSGKKILYFIGRLVDRKGVDVLIKAFSDISKQDNSLVLVIVGDGQNRREFEDLAESLHIADRVIFAGFLIGEERYALLELADVGVVPSVNVGDQAEGLPVVFMEGVTYGKAMVISDATGAHEVVQDGKNAFIAKAGSVSDLEEKLLQAFAVRQKNDKTFYKAVATLAKQFQWPSIIRRRYEVFQLDEL